MLIQNLGGGEGANKVHYVENRLFLSSPGPLYQNEVKCSAFDIELILTIKVLHLA